MCLCVVVGGGGKEMKCMKYKWLFQAEENRNLGAVSHSRPSVTCPSLPCMEIAPTPANARFLTISAVSGLKRDRESEMVI